MYKLKDEVLAKFEDDLDGTCGLLIKSKEIKTFVEEEVNKELNRVIGRIRYIYMAHSLDEDAMSTDLKNFLNREETK